jgi:hypothetical protein
MAVRAPAASGSSATRTGVDGTPWSALGLAVGPAAFVTGWVVGGAAMPSGYSPVRNAISRIAAVGSPERATMTAAFVVYGVGVAVGALGMRRTLLRPCWVPAMVNGLATLAVAATPLDRSSTVDALHGLSATIGYLTITAVPLVAAPRLRRHGFRRAAVLSLVGAVVSAVCLVLTAFSESKGLFQRVGLLSGDLWFVTTAVAATRGKLTR